MKKYVISILLLLPLFIKAQIISTYVGNGSGGCLGFGGLATSAHITDPLGCTFDARGNFYFANQQCQRVCKVDTNGLITIIAGIGTPGFSGDSGLAIAAELNYPNDVTFDSIGNLFFVDAQNCRIRRVDMTTGIITTVVGTGTPGFSGDSGLAISAKLNYPNGICFDRRGNLYISDADNNRIRKVNTSGIITTYAGTGIAGFSGDSGLAISAQIYTPFDLAIDKIGNLYFPDANNKRVRKIDTIGIITTIAGTGIGGYNGDGIPALNANFHPYKIAIDSLGNIYLSDSNRIRQIDISGIIHTVAGTSTPGYNGDGIIATTAQISAPSGIATDVCGSIYFGDVGNARIRKVTLPPILTMPSISLSGTGSIPVGSTVTVNATVTHAGSSYIIYWMNHGIEFTTTTVPTVTYIKTAGIDTITAKVVPTGYGCWDSSTSGGLIINTSSEASPLPSPGERVTVYPNPVHDVVHVDNVATPASYKIVNIVGSVMQLGTLQRSNQLFIKELPEGVYVLEVMDGEGGETVRKIVKE